MDRFIPVIPLIECRQDHITGIGLQMPIDVLPMLGFVAAAELVPDSVIRRCEERRRTAPHTGDVANERGPFATPAKCPPKTSAANAFA
jgi:hypothetical protein